MSLSEHLVTTVLGRKRVRIPRILQHFGASKVCELDEPRSIGYDHLLAHTSGHCVEAYAVMGSSGG